MKLFLVYKEIKSVTGHGHEEFEIFGLFKSYTNAVKFKDRLVSEEKFKYDKQFYCVKEIESDF